MCWSDGQCTASMALSGLSEKERAEVVQEYYPTVGKSLVEQWDRGLLSYFDVLVFWEQCGDSFLDTHCAMQGTTKQKGEED